MIDKRNTKQTSLYLLLLFLFQLQSTTYSPMLGYRAISKLHGSTSPPPHSQCYCKIGELISWYKLYIYIYITQQSPWDFEKYIYLNLFFYSRQLALFVGRRLMITWLFKVKVIGIYIVIRHPLPIHTSRCHDHNLAVNIDFDNFYLNVNRDNKLLGF